MSEILDYLHRLAAKVGFLTGQHLEQGPLAEAERRMAEQRRHVCGAVGHQINGTCPNCGQQQVDHL